MTIISRGRYLSLVKRVPKRFHAIEERRQVWLCLYTDSRELAAEKASAVWDQQISAWEMELAGQVGAAQERFDAAREIAAQRGLRYLPVDKVAELPVTEILDRIGKARTKDGRLRESLAAGTLGTVPKPQVNVSKALELYWGLSADRLVGKSADQIRRWENPRKRAVKNFIDVVGDLALDQITPEDMQDFRDFWLARVNERKVTADSANKDFTHLADVLSTVNRAKRLGIDLPIRGWTLRRGEKGQRAAFSTDWIREKFLAPGALSGLNDQARDLFLGMVNTGARPSELACLGPEQIHLEGKIPHISIEPVGRTLKSQHARRRIPLLGVSLEAFKRHPDGFPRYAQSADPAAAINKYLEENKLREVTGRNGTTVYSLRHAFQERMVACGVDDRLRRELFGHTLTEERYGNPSLYVLRDALRPVAL